MRTIISDLSILIRTVRSLILFFIHIFTLSLYNMCTFIMLYVHLLTELNLYPEID
ncbi:hypothetical protein SAMN04487777_107150 [Priestia aryabhattai B8W22]|nr:hypothetical protein SAMN04487777_107150 [Priestia aryabhattai B8W22]